MSSKVELRTLRDRPNLLGAVGAFAILVGACASTTPSSGSTYTSEFAWQSVVPGQAYDARTPGAIRGWTQMTVDFASGSASEVIALCYPGDIKFEFEQYVDSDGTWIRDLTGSRYGGRVLQIDEVFADYAVRTARGHLFLLQNPQVAASIGQLELKEEEGVVIATTESYTTVFSGLESTRGITRAQDVSISLTGRNQTIDQRVSRTSVSDDPLRRPDWLTPRSNEGDVESIEVERLSDRVYVVKGVADRRNVLGIRGEGGWLMIGAPTSSDTSKRTLEALAEETGERNVGAVFVGHAHSDHIGGLRYFADLGAEVILSEAVREQLRVLGFEWLDESRVTTFRGIYSISVANTLVEFYEIENTHALGLSFSWLPDLKLVYQGDFISVPRDKTLAPATRFPLKS